MKAGGAGAGLEVDARIVYWGVDGAGKSTNLRAVYAKLRPDHRGPLREMPTRIDPSQSYLVLPIELGDVQGVRTRLQVIAVPGGAEHAPTRKGLLDRVDGIVFVIDAQRARIDDNVAALEELRGALAAYGRSLESVPLVLQYNKRDLCDPTALEELHRKLAVPGATVFEAVARDGAGVLQTLTTISKRVIRKRREQTAARESGLAATPALRAPGPALPLATAIGVRGDPGAAAKRAALAPESAEIVRTAERAERVLDASWQEITSRLHAQAIAEAEAATVVEDPPAPRSARASGAPLATLAIASVGAAARIGPRAVQLPLVLRDEAGRELSLTLTVQLDPLLAPEPRGET